jgi:MFS family permease
MPVQKITLLVPLRNRNFRYLAAGEIVSDLGDWLDFLAIIALIVYRWGLGPTALAAFSVATVLPRVLLAPVAGVWADRLDRRTVMIGADLARVPVVLAMVFAPDLTTLLALVVLKGCFSTFFTPAWQATIRATVPEEDLLAANSLSQLSLQMMKVLGPALGGVLVAVSGPRAAFVADAVSFLLSAAFLSRLPAMPPEPGAEEEGPQPSFWGEFQAGFMFLIRNKVLAISVGSVAAAMFIIFTFDGLGALALKDVGVNEALFGLAVGAIGLGTAIGAAAIGQWGMRFNPLRIIGTGQLLAGVMVVLVGIAALLRFDRVPVAWIPGWFLIGLAGAAMFVPYGYVLLRETPEELMGRVSASANAVATTAQLLAPPLGAAVAEWRGVGFVFVVSGAILALIGVAVLVMRLPLKEDPESAKPGLTESVA